MEWNELSGQNIVVPPEVYNKGCVNTVEEAIKAGSAIGYPIMIKASEGGGGKGIRKVDCPENIHGAFRQVGMKCTTCAAEWEPRPSP